MSNRTPLSPSTLCDLFAGGKSPVGQPLERALVLLAFGTRLRIQQPDGRIFFDRPWPLFAIVTTEVDLAILKRPVANVWMEEMKTPSIGNRQNSEPGIVIEIEAPSHARPLYGRKEPYTERGIRRVPCTRCGRPARYTWNVCADGNLYRPICEQCDIALNEAVLRFMNFPEDVVQNKIEAYKRLKGV